MRFRLAVTFVTLVAAASAVASPISQKYASLGGQNGFLGKPTGPESTCPDGVGSYRHYEHGSIYFHPSTAAHEVHGLIEQRWSQLGWEQSYLGYPMSDEMDLYDGSGRVSKFQGGELVWRSATNQVSEIRSTDLVVDVPFKAGEAWQIIQANADQNGGSHSGPFVYCWDLILAGHPQPDTNGRQFVAAATDRIVYVDEGFDGSNNIGNTIVQRFGLGRYGSYLHLKKGSYTKELSTSGGIQFLPQALPWTSRPMPKSGTVLADCGDVGANSGAYHLHFCVTTTPDRQGIFGPFESVPVAFRNYSYSTDNGAHWTYVAVGVPKNGMWIRREAPKPGQPGPAQVNGTIVSFGTVKGTVTPPQGHPTAPGKLTVGVTSAWGEPLRMKTINVSGNGPWPFDLGNVPAFNGSKAYASYSGPWSQPYDTIAGEGAAFDLGPNATVNQTLNLKLMLIK